MGYRQIPSEPEECRQIAVSVRRILAAKYLHDERRLFK
jgi:hypothetical protein